MITYDLYNVTIGTFVSVGHYSRSDTIHEAKRRCVMTTCDYSVIARPTGTVVFSTRKDWVRHGR